MSSFAFNETSINNPPPATAQLYKRFLEQGGQSEDFALRVAQNARSLTVQVAKKAGNAVAFQSRMLRVSQADDHNHQELVELTRKINATTQILQIP